MELGKKYDVKERNINIVAGEEYQLHILDENSNISGDFFYDVHCKAFKEVSKIVNKNKSLDNEQNSKSIIEASNNIICFCGERGQGKSSAMLSFSNMLKNIDKENIETHFSEYIKEIKNKKFYILSRIDPTELENQHSILSVIISRMFFVFKEYLNNNTNMNLIEKNEILDLFQKCYKNIGIIKNEDNKKDYCYNDDIELLSNLSDSANIKNDFYKLVNGFLKHIAKKEWLVLQIDDTDLNVNKAYEIVEDIRKYFMMPKVIVLMATKLDQLTEAIEQNYIKSFNYLLEADRIPLREFHNMATKYIGKLIPGSRCIILPDVALHDIGNSYQNFTLEYKGYRTKTDEPTIDLCGPFQETILKIVYDKTGIIFAVPQNSSHKIIPRTARGLANFLSVLNGMDDIKKVNSFDELSEKDIYLRLKNLDKFEEYFLNTWIEEKIDIRFIEPLRDWVKAPWESKNKLIIYNIADLGLFPELYLSPLKRDRRYYNENIDLYTVKTKNNAFNLSDIFDTLKKMDDYYPQSNSTNFHFAIRVLYSIMLNKLILKQVLEESNYAIGFIGDVFGENVNSFMRKEYKKYDRAKFSFRLTNDEFYKWRKKHNLSEKILYSLFIDGDEVKDNKIGGSWECTFNVSSPLIKLLQPKQVFLSQLRVNNDICNEQIYSDYEKLRYICFQIVSNADVLLKLGNELPHKQHYIAAAHYSEHIIDFYKRIVEIINDIDCLEFLNNPFETISNIINNSQEWIEFVFGNRYIDKDVYINVYSRKLEPYQGTTTFELLRERLMQTLEVFNELTELNLIDISYETQEIRTIAEKNKVDRKVGPSTYKKCQAVINKMRKSALEKLESLS